MRVVIADDHRLILDGVRRALEADGGFEIVGETQSGKDVLVESALRRGASAYLVKSVEPDDLPSTLRQVASGTVYAGIAREPIHHVPGEGAGITEREVAILAALVRGLSNDEIAKEFWIAHGTVKFHLTNIYRKLGVKSRTEAVHRAYQLGLVDAPRVDDED
jgi:DNA-binding NarL/FixJ family response regulator